MENYYTRNITKRLTEDKVWDLFRWKNGMELFSEQKATSIKNVYLPEIKRWADICDPLPDITLARDYIRKLKGRAIWNIFWLHCLNPKRYPIFDQHTFRAMRKIVQGKDEEIPDSNDEKIDIYFNEYIPFIEKMGSDFKKLKKLDEALFTYGQFLASKFHAPFKKEVFKTSRFVAEYATLVEKGDPTAPIRNLNDGKLYYFKMPTPIIIQE